MFCVLPQTQPAEQARQGNRKMSSLALHAAGAATKAAATATATAAVSASANTATATAAQEDEEALPFLSSSAVPTPQQDEEVCRDHQNGGIALVGTSSSATPPPCGTATVGDDPTVECDALSKDVGCTDDNDDDKEVSSMPLPPPTPPERAGSDGGSSSSLPLQQHHHTILALYHFQLLEDPEQMRVTVDRFLRNHCALGGIILASEGINGTICYPTTAPCINLTKVSARSEDSIGGDRSDGVVTPAPQEEEDDDGDEPERAIDDVNNNANDVVLAWFRQTFPGIRVRVSYSTDGPVFFRLRVRCKAEIVTMGVPQLVPLVDINDNNNQHHNGMDGGTITTAGGDAGSSSSGSEDARSVRVGQHVSPRDWNNLVRDPTTWLIDARNDYEVQVGTFVGSENPGTTTFTEWPDWVRAQWKDKVRLRQSDPAASPLPSRIAMFCTGGIRCEKATAYCHDVVGGSNIPIYHLEGGILAYLDEVPPNDSLFLGECYVFDRRVAVTHGLHPSQQYSACHACRHPLTPSDLTHPAFVSGISCPHCLNDPEKQLRRDRYVAREKQMRVASDLGIVHLGSTAAQSCLHGEGPVQEAQL